jgi:ferredoxin
MAAAPEVFRLRDEDGELEVLDEHPPESARAQVERAILLCPTQALALED